MKTCSLPQNGSDIWNRKCNEESLCAFKKTIFFLAKLRV